MECQMDELGPDANRRLAASGFTPVDAMSANKKIRWRSLNIDSPPSHKTANDLVEAGHLGMKTAKCRTCVAIAIVRLAYNKVADMFVSAAKPRGKSDLPWPAS